MAYTVATIDQSVQGDKRVVVLSCVADAATQAIDTGLSAVDFISYSPKSMTAEPKIMLNQLAAGTASVGTVSVSGVTSGDEFWLVCYGH